ncbi:MAG: ABC transporter ATP-binding protein [Rhodomicrobium sp.]
MLLVEDLSVSYGPVRAVRGLNLEVCEGEIIALTGANGAGKTSTVKAIAGLLPYSGSVVFQGRKLVPGSADRNVSKGLAIVLEGRGILGRMSVEENLLMGTYSRRDTATARSEIHDIVENFPILQLRKKTLASLLSGGEQQMLAIARALLSKPKLLILDEPSLGLAPKMSAFVFSLMEKLRANGLTILLVEQKVRHALKIASRAYLLENGSLVRTGLASELINDHAVSEAFLGGHTNAPGPDGPARKAAQ